MRVVAGGWWEVPGFCKVMAPEDGRSNWTLAFQSFDFLFWVAVTHFPGAESETTGFLHYKDRKTRLAKSLEIGGPNKKKQQQS